MCGIAGFLAPKLRDDERSTVLARMCQVIERRGPDSQGAYVRDGLALGIRRLAINDLAGGDQPLFNEDRSLALVCNGEIYNSPDLRNRLEAKGHRFRTHSDCEAIIHAYEEWGTGCLDELNGMFSVALWDGRLNQLLLARDRSGIKPLHYAVLDHGEIVFGSEIKAILQHPAVPHALSLDALVEYLSYEYVPTPHTIFRAIRKLPPGHFLTYSTTRGARLSQYWDLSLGGDNAVDSRPMAEVVAEVRAALEASVQAELLSDVPVGALLSGGLDSSTVAAIMARLSDKPIQTFSIGFAEPSFDESSYARLVANHIKSDHHELILRAADLSDLLPEVADFLDEPLGDASIIPTYALSRFARQGVKVALGGDGGDELFGGYPTLKAHKVAAHARRVPASMRRLAQRGMERLPVSKNNISLDFQLKRFMLGLPHDAAVRHQLWLGSFSPGQSSALLSSEAAAQLQPQEPFTAALDHVGAHSEWPELNKILYLDYKLYLENDILVKVDRASMARGLEVRVPLLNQIVVDCVSRLAPQLKLHGFDSKFVLKAAVKDLLPPAIPRRRKKGFGLPVGHWFSDELKPLLLDVLDPAKLESQGLFRGSEVRSLMEDHFANRRDNRKPLWTLFMFQLWLERYGAGSY